MKTALTITVRMKSERLPRKAMRDLAGRPMIEHLIERLKTTKLPDEIVLCTSTNPQDKILTEVARRNGIEWFNGDEVDVLRRLLDMARKYRVDFIVSTTGDNPLTDPVYADKIIENFVRTNADYITCPELPLGTFSYGLKVEALERVVELKKEKDTEIWGIYFTNSNMFKRAIVDVQEELRHPEIRLTVDTPEDFQLMEEIYRRLYEPGRVFKLQDVMRLLEKNPQLTHINRKVTQKVAPTVDLSNMM